MTCKISKAVQTHLKNVGFVGCLVKKRKKSKF